MFAQHHPEIDGMRPVTVLPSVHIYAGLRGFVGDYTKPGSVAIRRPVHGSLIAIKSQVNRSFISSFRHVFYLKSRSKCVICKAVKAKDR